MKRVPSADSDVLLSLETLLVAGFASPHRPVVNETILFWNTTFGAQDSLKYPPKLESVLRARMIDASIDLPTFPDSNPDHVPATLTDFFESASQNAISVPAPNRLAHLSAPPHGADRKRHPSQSMYFTAQISPAVTIPNIPSSIDRRSAASGSSTPKARLRHDDSQVQFAPIDSSPRRFEDDSQHLTEHQKEVKARQNEAAQIFPELSSSPMAQLTALPRALPKRLDFSTSEVRVGDDDIMGTPTALPDAIGLMSDDMPSSPTPSFNKDASQAVLDIHDDQATDDELDEPPSSPPRSVDGKENGARSDAPDHHQIGPDDTTVEITDFGLPDLVDAANMPVAEDDLGEEPLKHTVDTNERDQLDIASDSILPTEQLQLEAEAAEMVASALNMMPDAVDEGAGVTKSRYEETDKARPIPSAQSGYDVITRVEDSFVGQPQETEADQEEAPDSQSSRKSTRKRKRSASEVYTAKKQKSASPFKRFISKIWPASQQDDDDMEDEIVVASSQRSQSPSSPPARQNEPPAQSVEEPTTEVAAIKREVMAPPPKRRPGRPRKSATPTPSLSQSIDEASQTRSLKRTASVLSNASATEAEASSSFVKDTPAPSKSRKGRKGQTASQSSAASSAQQGSQTGHSTRRTATAVMVSPPGRESEATAKPTADEHDIDKETADEGDNIEVATPQKQSQNAGAATDRVEERPKLTPRSILGRLRDALSDFVGMKVSTSEAREFDDLLFEFRREVHEADRRERAE